MSISTLFRKGATFSARRPPKERPWGGKKIRDWDRGKKNSPQNEFGAEGGKIRTRLRASPSRPKEEKKGGSLARPLQPPIRHLRDPVGLAGSVEIVPGHERDRLSQASTQKKMPLTKDFKTAFAGVLVLAWKEKACSRGRGNRDSDLRKGPHEREMWVVKPQERRTNQGGGDLPLGP